MSKRLSGMTAIVSGASSGIGEATAHALAAEGMNIVIAARRKDKLAAVAGEINALGKGQALPVAADVTKEEDVANLFKKALEHLGHLDLLVNVAGVAQATPIEDMPYDEWRMVLDASITSVFLTGREAFRVFKPQNRGRIISIGSISAKAVRPDAVAYCAAKYGLDGMTRAMGLEGRDHNITCSVIHPGFVATGFGPDAGTEPSRNALAAEDVARLVVLAADLPDEANLLDTTITPIGQPFLGRG